METKEYIRQLTQEGEDLLAEFDLELADRGCHCHISPPCSYCVHPGNPSNLEESSEMWVMVEKKEYDPNGLKPSDPGAKLDGGKPRAGQILKQFSHALWEVSRVGTFGAEKYSMGGWQHVEDAENRYCDAGVRHFLFEGMGETNAADSKLLHLSHECWNKLAELEKHVRALKEKGEWKP